jgi:hypothetical protein
MFSHLTSHVLCDFLLETLHGAAPAASLMLPRHVPLTTDEVVLNTRKALGKCLGLCISKWLGQAGRPIDVACNFMRDSPGRWASRQPTQGSLRWEYPSCESSSTHFCRCSLDPLLEEHNIRKGSAIMLGVKMHGGNNQVCNAQQHPSLLVIGDKRGSKYDGKHSLAK